MAQPGGTEGLHLHPWARRSLSPGGLQPWDYVLQPDKVPHPVCPKCPRGGLLTYASAPSTVGIGIAAVPSMTDTTDTIMAQLRDEAKHQLCYCYRLQAWIENGIVSDVGSGAAEHQGETHPVDCPDCH